MQLIGSSLVIVYLLKKDDFCLGGLSMKKLLEFYTFCGMDRGGAETFIMNVYRKIDRNKFQFDFVVTTDKNVSTMMKYTL